MQPRQVGPQPFSRRTFSVVQTAVLLFGFAVAVFADQFPRYAAAAMVMAGLAAVFSLAFVVYARSRIRQHNIHSNPSVSEPPYLAPTYFNKEQILNSRSSDDASLVVATMAHHASYRSKLVCRDYDDLFPNSTDNLTYYKLWNDAALLPITVPNRDGDFVVSVGKTMVSLTITKTHLTLGQWDLHSSMSKAAKVADRHGIESRLATRRNFPQALWDFDDRAVSQ